MKTATETNVIDMERLFKLYQQDHRARQIIDMCVAHGLNETGEPDERNFRRFADDVAKKAVAALLMWIYDNDAELGRLATERDHYKRLAEEGLRLSPLVTFASAEPKP